MHLSKSYKIFLNVKYFLFPIKLTLISFFQMVDQTLTFQEGYHRVTWDHHKG